MIQTKFRVKTSSLELEFEGTEVFLKEELTLLVKTMLAHSQRSDTSVGKLAIESRGSNGDAGRFEQTTGSIAARLNVESGPDLILAAACRMTFVKTQYVFSRDEITAEMKSATAYFKATYLNNLTKYLQGLVKRGKLIERAAGTYSLSAAARSEFEAGLHEV